MGLESKLGGESLNAKLTINGRSYECGVVGSILVVASAIGASYLGFKGTDELMQTVGLDHGYFRTLIDFIGLSGSSVIAGGATTFLGSFLPGGRRY